MAAVQDDEEGAAWWKPRDKVLVEDIAVDLAPFLEIYRTDSVEDTGRTVSSGITHLAAMSGVVEEVASSGFTD
jgi:hypothetical protein